MLLSGIANTWANGVSAESKVHLSAAECMGVTLLAMLHKSLLLVQRYRVTWATFYRIALRWCDKFSAFSAV